MTIDVWQVRWTLSSAFNDYRRRSFVTSRCLEYTNNIDDIVWAAETVIISLFFHVCHLWVKMSYRFSTWAAPHVMCRMPQHHKLIPKSKKKLRNNQTEFSTILCASSARDHDRKQKKFRLKPNNVALCSKVACAREFFGAGSKRKWKWLFKKKTLHTGEYVWAAENSENSIQTSHAITQIHLQLEILQRWWHHTRIKS